MNDTHSMRSTSMLSNLRYDIPAGIVVFLVAVPLCLGIALASQAPLFSGIITGIIGGIVVGALSGSQLSVSGPAAGLTVLVVAAIQKIGSFEAFLAAVFLAGLIQIVFGLLRAGVVGSAFPNSVIKGMLAAIGIIIILKQIPHAIGWDADYVGDFGFKELSSGDNTFTAIGHALGGLHWGATAICVASLAVILIWESRFIASQPRLKLIPGSLLAVGLGVILNLLFERIAPSLYLRPGSGHLVALPIATDFQEFLGLLRFPTFASLREAVVIQTALVIAVIGSIETLLSVEATDKLDPERRISNKNRELLAQGVGNVLAGAVGGLPLTAVVVRSSANIYAGARTRFSAIFHGMLLLFAASLLPFWLNQIPLAALAAVLLSVGYKLAKIKIFKEMWAGGNDQFIPFLLTVLAVVLTDLLTGVFLGLVGGFVMVLLTNYYSAVNSIHEGNDYLIRFTKDVSFINKIRLKSELSTIPDGANVLIDGSRAFFIDHDIYEILEDFQEAARHRGIKVELRNLEQKQYRLGPYFGFFRRSK